MSAKKTPSTLRIGYRYRPNRLAVQYDAIVIGSGMGGLTNAALLSELGWKVCVLEQHYTAGGYTHSYNRNGYEWDVGVHYIGDVGSKTRSWRMFDFLSDGKLEWAPMDAEYDRFYIGDKVFNAIAGKQAFRDNLVASFPKEEQAIDRYLELLAEVGGALSTHSMGRVLKPWQRTLGAPLLKWRTPANMYRNTYEVLSELTDDQDLIAVLCGQWGDMGLPPKRSAFMVHAMIARHYMYGGYYPVGGSWRIAESIIPKIQEAGGEVCGQPLAASRLGPTRDALRQRYFEQTPEVEAKQGHDERQGGDKHGLLELDPPSDSGFHIPTHRQRTGDQPWRGSCQYQRRHTP